MHTDALFSKECLLFAPSDFRGLGERVLERGGGAVELVSEQLSSATRSAGSFDFTQVMYLSQKFSHSSCTYINQFLHVPVMQIHSFL